MFVSQSLVIKLLEFLTTTTTTTEKPHFMEFLDVDGVLNVNLKDFWCVVDVVSFGKKKCDRILGILKKFF